MRALFKTCWIAILQWRNEISCNNVSYSFSPDFDGCFDVKLITAYWGVENSWSLGSCQSIGTYGAHNQYTERCCLETGSYTLKCKDSGHNGWHGGYIELFGQTYCDRFLSGSEQSSQITVTGKYFSYFSLILPSYIGTKFVFEFSLYFIFSICTRLRVFCNNK